MKSFSIGFGRHRMHVGLEKDGALHTAGLMMGTDLRARHYTAEAKDALERALHRKFSDIHFDRLGAQERALVKDLTRLGLIKDHALGSGLVTNVGVMALANDFNWAAPSGAAINTLKLANFHATGTGATAAAATDIKLQTVSTQGGQTPVAGAQTMVSAANVQKYQSVATITYAGAESVTEWGLHLSGTLSAATGSPFTAGTAATGTVTATPLTASTATVQGQQQTIFERTSGTNLSYGLVLSNTTSVITVPAWYLVASGLAGQAPANTETYVIRPVMWDHKVFGAITVGATDSIQFTYVLTINSGG